VLAVLRPESTQEAHRQLEQLLAVGLRHVELAVEREPARHGAWISRCRQLHAAFPQLRLGAASVRCSADLELSLAAGFNYAVSPIFDPELIALARQAGITLVPGVFTPTEIDRALRCGCAAVKLFPARAVGPHYWRSLAGPLGPLPFCIAAGGLHPCDVSPWLEAGVDAVALGSALFAPNSDHRGIRSHLDPGLASVLGCLTEAAEPGLLST
jgi:2-dehydro-3-deoxyphosphogluconate aldolase/(4S)-4-hydroxy-2-oxoglutarate aldolase